MKENRILILSVLVLAMLVLIVYRGSGKHQFVEWDDSEYVKDNPLVTKPESGLWPVFSTVISLNYHPVTILSMKMDNNKCKECPWGISAKPFILGNIFLHLLNTLLVFFVFRMLSGRKILAPFIAAALFAVHPMHVESVAWVSARKDVLYTFFFLAGMITYLKYAEKGHPGWIVATFLLFVLSCLSKAVAVVFPVVLLLLCLYKNQEDEQAGWKKALSETFSKRNLLILAPFFAVSVFFGLIASALQDGKNFFGLFSFLNDHKKAVDLVSVLSPLQHVGVGAYGAINYIVRFFYPSGLSPFHPYPMLPEFSHGFFPVELWFSVIAVIALAVFAIRSLRHGRLFFFSLGFFFVTIILVLQVFSVGTAIIAERYTYLPYAGLAFLPATLIEKTSGRLKTILLSIAALFVIALMFLARQQVKVWTNSGTLWSQVIKQYPSLDLSREGRGKYYYLLSSKASGTAEKERLENLALADFNIAMEVGSNDADVFDATGVILYNRGELDKAVSCIDKAISIEPANGGFYYNRAMVHDAMGNKEKAINDYSTALGLEPGMKIRILGNRAVLYTETSRFVQAEADLDKLILSDSSNHMYFFNRAYVRVKRENYTGAADDYRRVLSLKPDNEEARRQLQILIDNGIK